MFNFVFPKAVAILDFKVSGSLTSGNYYFLIHNRLLLFPFYISNKIVNFERSSVVMSGISSSDFDHVRFEFWNFYRKNVNHLFFSDHCCFNNANVEIACSLSSSFEELLKSYI